MEIWLAIFSLNEILRTPLPLVDTKLFLRISSLDVFLYVLWNKIQKWINKFNHHALSENGNEHAQLVMATETNSVGDSGIHRAKFRIIRLYYFNLT